MTDNFGVDPDPEIFEVHSILDKSWRTGEEMFLIRWKGYETEEYDTWEPRQNLSNCPEILRKFQRTAYAKRIDREHREQERRIREQMKIERIRQTKLALKEEKVPKSQPKSKPVKTRFDSDSSSSSSDGNTPLLSPPSPPPLKKKKDDKESKKNIIASTKTQPKYKKYVLKMPLSQAPPSIESDEEKSTPKNKIRKNSTSLSRKTTKQLDSKREIVISQSSSDESDDKVIEIPKQENTQIESTRQSENIDDKFPISSFPLKLHNYTPQFLPVPTMQNQINSQPAKPKEESEPDKFVFEYTTGMKMESFVPKKQNLNFVYNVDPSIKLPKGLNGKPIVKFSDIELVKTTKQVIAHLEDGKLVPMSINLAKILAPQILIDFLFAEKVKKDRKTQNHMFL